MSIEDVDILELTDRYNFLIKKYSELALKLAPMLVEFGKYKKELQILTVELVRRNVVLQDPEKLKELVTEALEKRGIDIDEQTKAT